MVHLAYSDREFDGKTKRTPMCAGRLHSRRKGSSNEFVLEANKRGIIRTNSGGLVLFTPGERPGAIGHEHDRTATKGDEHG
jgi:hypothetical protein